MPTLVYLVRHLNEFEAVWMLRVRPASIKECLLVIAQVIFGEWHEQVNDSGKVFSRVEVLSISPISLRFLDVGPDFCLMCLPVLCHFLVQSNWVREDLGPLCHLGNVLFQFIAF